MKKLIIYDLDGTLVDTAEDIASSANYMRAQFHLPPISREKIAGFVGRGVHPLISGCLETQDERQIEKGIKIYREFYGKHMLDHSRLFPGVLDFLNYFKQRKQAVLTNKPNPYSKDMLHQLGIGDYFFDIVGGNSGFPKKPDAAVILNWMKQAGFLSSEAAMVGDSVIDIETCRNAGIDAAVVTHGFESRDALQSHAPEVLADGFNALLRMVKQKGW